ncbi:putative thioredoxin [Hyphomonas neptunium ATCC 15444]|uniref:Putative thioredoxin n=2 Tax=Hyphomonas TaxID=85 RepID=Q0BZH2_HYPNA|nr:MULTISPECIES: thioredoxin domain-containing protein [Hyphomonas]ABI76432.1 putative thioredoxin [Hyphomonas neptunium ATCC 15444]KCZ95210.1 putative thioredoxin [Hyphomonas hirschiana VP5]
MASEDRMIVCLACNAVNRVPEGRALTAAKCGRCAGLLATPHPAEITNDQMRALEKKDTGAFIVDLWAPWCGPCRMMAPHYDAAAERLQGDVRFYKINTDQHPDAAVRLNIRGVPTLVAWKGGRELTRQSGAPAGGALERWVRGLFGLAPAPN